VWNAVYGPTVAGHAAQAARPFIPSYAKNVIARAAAQAKCARFNGGTSCTEASVEAFLKHEMFSGGSVPKFEKSKGKKPTSVNHSAATSSTAATAVDLVDEDDDHLDKHATTDGHVREAVYASVAFTAAQPVEIDATAAEAAAASKAATAAHEAAAKAAYTPLEEDDLPKKSSGGADPTGEACEVRVPVFAVGDSVRVLALTAPGYLPRLATGFPEARVEAYNADTGEYTVKAYMSSRQQTKIPRYAVVAVSRDGNEELRTRGGLLSSEGAKAVVQAERRTAELEKLLKDEQLRAECAEKTAKVATDRAAASGAKAAAAAAETSALFSGNLRYPRFSTTGRALVRRIEEAALIDVERKEKDAETLLKKAGAVASKAKRTAAELHERELKRQKRHVSNRDKEIDKLTVQLEKSNAEESKQHNKNLAGCIKAQKDRAEIRLLRKQRDAAVANNRKLEERFRKETCKIDEETAELKIGTEVWPTTRSNTKGRPYSLDFEAHAVSCMATGISASQCRVQMLLHVKYIFKDNKEAEEAFVVPEVNWFRILRERVGTESLLYALIKIAGAKEVLQFGSDETGIRRQGTYNQWCMIKKDDNSTEIVTFEVGGILVGATAEQVAAHVETTWQRGQDYLKALRLELGDAADELVPMVNGGVNLLKLRTFMHDTVRQIPFLFLYSNVSPLCPI